MTRLTKKGDETPISDGPIGDAREDVPTEHRSTEDIQKDRVTKVGEPDMNAASTDGTDGVGNRYPLTDAAVDNLSASLEAEAADLEAQAEAKRAEAARVRGEEPADESSPTDQED